MLLDKDQRMLAKEIAKQGVVMTDIVLLDLL
jgi:hypothetical protein